MSNRWPVIEVDESRITVLDGAWCLSSVQCCTDSPCLSRVDGSMIKVLKNIATVVTQLDARFNATFCISAIAWQLLPAVKKIPSRTRTLKVDWNCQSSTRSDELRPLITCGVFTWFYLCTDMPLWLEATITGTLGRKCIIPICNGSYAGRSVTCVSGPVLGACV